jgi:cytochrome o ubiquinol oxidase subunit 2
MRHFSLERPLRAARFAVALLLLPLLAGCSSDVLFPAGDIALQQRNLILISTGLMLIIIIPVLVLIVVFAWRYRKGSGAVYDPKFDHSTSLELIIWACPLLIIIFLGALTWSSTHLLDPFRPLDRISAGKPVPEGTKTLEVQVIAMDWKWLFILPEQGIATVNELALPVDVPVRFSITSTSQMNTFYAPTLAGMIYAMPGMRSMLHAVLNRPVDTWGYSGNYTGAGYSDMRFKLKGLPQADFDRWVAEVKATQGAPLNLDKYNDMAKPTVKEPIAKFATVANDLFDRVVKRCLDPAKPCEADTMDHKGHGSDKAGATPALQKAPEDKGTGPNVTKPADPNAPQGSNAPGHDHK